METLFSLDFLNKKTFDTDIFSESGEKLVSKGDEVTSEMILKLYFKKIYSSLKQEDSQKERQEEQPIEQPIEIEKDKEGPVETTSIRRVFNPAQFDEEHAKSVAYHSVKIGKLMHLTPEQITYLRDAAYNHDIGKALLTREEFTNKIDKQMVAQLGSSYLSKEKRAAECVCGVALKCHQRYTPKEFALKRANSDFPLHHIVSLVDFYMNLKEKGEQKENIIKILLKLGAERFNIYILHKFIYKLRTENE